MGFRRRRRRRRLAVMVRLIDADRRVGRLKISSAHVASLFCFTMGKMAKYDAVYFVLIPGKSPGFRIP